MSRDLITNLPFSRPMAEQDIAWLEESQPVANMRVLLEDFTRDSLPVMNGGFRYSNLSEGPEHLFTFNCYRQWEYASVVERLPELGQSIRFLDVGGAGSLLPYFLAARGHPGVTVELNPLLVSVCQEVSAQRKLPLRAMQGDAGKGLLEAGTGFDLVTMISVLEHVPPKHWPALFRNVADVLRPGGWFYLTFDYGDYETEKPFGRSIREIASVLRCGREAGLVPRGDDPADLSEEWLKLRCAPGHEEAGRRLLLNLGRVDGGTPWIKVVRHLMKRMVVPFMRPHTRYAKHNFFRLLLEKK